MRTVDIKGHENVTDWYEDSRNTSQYHVSKILRQPIGEEGTFDQDIALNVLVSVINNHKESTLIKEVHVNGK